MVCLLLVASPAAADILDAAAVAAAIRQKLQALPDIKSVELGRFAPVAAQPGGFELIVPTPVGSATSGVASLIIRDGGKITRNMRVPYKLVRCQLVYVAAADLQQGQQLAAAQVVSEERCDNPRKTPLPLGGFAAYRVRQPIARGGQLVPELLERVVHARAHSQVSLRIVSAGTLVTSVGKLLADATIGGSARVQVPGGRELAGQLVAADQVEVVL